MKALIIQGIIPHYRVPFFDALARRKNLDVTVLHSGAPTIHIDVGYKEIVVDKFSLKGFNFQHKVLKIVNHFDVVIAMFDLWYISTVIMAIANYSQNLIWWGRSFGKNPLANKLRLFLLKYANVIILYNEQAKKHFLQKGYPAERIFVAHNTIYVPNHQFNSDCKRTEFLFVGRLQPRKKLEDLIIAFNRVKDTLPPSVKISIVGEGEIRARLEETVRQHNLEKRVKFYGEITDENLLKPIFQRSLAYVSPGHVGLGVLHSFAYGIPVVTNRYARHAPEFENAIDNINSCLYDGSIEDLSRVLVNLAGRPEKSLELGEKAYHHYSEKRTLENMVSSFEEAIRYALSSQK